MERRTGKRLRLYLGILVATALAAVAAPIAYFVFIPMTVYWHERGPKDTEAIKRAVALTRPRPLELPARTEPATSVTSQTVAVSPRESSPAPSVSPGVSPGVSFLLNTRDPNASAILRDLIDILPRGSAWGHSDWDVFQWIVPSEISERIPKFVFSGTDAVSEIGDAVFAELRRRPFSWLVGRTKARTPRDPVVRRRIVEGLDTLERLLHKRQSSDGDDSPGYGSLRDFSIRALLLRTALRGETDTTSAILKWAIENASLQRLKGEPYWWGYWPGNVAVLDLIGPLQELASIPGVPDTVLDEAQSVLDACRVGPGQMEDLRVAHVYQVAETFLTESMMGQRGQNRSKGNTWSFLFGGTPERFVARGLDPVLQVQIDRLTAAWAKGDADAIRAEEAGLERVEWFFNRQDIVRCYEEAFYGVQFPYFKDRAHSQAHKTWARQRAAARNDDIDMARLVLAAIRFRRAQGRHAEAIRELVEGGYLLDTGFLATAPKETAPGDEGIVRASLWTILRMNDFSVPYQVLDSDLPPSADTFFVPVEHYEQEHNGLKPASAAELAPYLPPGTDLAEVQKRFVQLGPMPVFCRIDLGVGGVSAKSRENATGNADTEPGEDGARTAQTDATRPTGLQVLSVSYVWLPDCSLPKDLIELLKEEPSAREWRFAPSRRSRSPFPGNPSLPDWAL